MTFVSLHGPGEQLALELGDIITKAGIYAPRSKQVAIGPSEVGHECVRRLAYKMLDWEKVNESQGGNWVAQVGTAIHAHLADIFAKIEGYEVEQRVTIRPGLSGTVDLYDAKRGIVMDWKTTGFKGLQERRSQGATHQQLVQVMLYGYGKAQTGALVNQVALIYLPTSGGLDEMHVELHDYNEQMALDALARIDNITQTLVGIDVENNPKNWAVLPKTASKLCSYCPYFLPYSDDLAKACDGFSRD
jgi:hypothetical protein